MPDGFSVDLDALRKAASGIRASRAVKRVDQEGRPHGGVYTPHVAEDVRNTNPKTGEVFVRPSNDVRAAFPWEIP